MTTAPGAAPTHTSPLWLPTSPASPVSSVSIVRRFRILVRLAGAGIALYGLMSVVAAQLGYPASAHAPLWMGCGCAMGLLLLGTALALQNPWPRASVAAAGAAMAWCLVVLGWGPLRLAGMTAAWAPPLALMLVLAAMFLLGQRWRSWGAALALATAFAVLLVLLEQLLAAPQPPWGSGGRILSPTMALCFLLLSLGWLAVEPHRRPMAYLLEPGSAGWLMRRLLPLILAFPYIAAWIGSGQDRRHPATAWMEAVLFVLGSFVVFLTLTWKAATALDRLDTSRSDLQAYAHEIGDLYQHAPCGYHSLDAQGRFVNVNGTELAWLGYRREEVIGRLVFTDLLTPEGREAFERNFPLLCQSGEMQDLELELRRKDGSLLPAVVSTTAIRDARGRFLRSRSSVFDATRRRQAEAALRQSEAHNRAILASVADAIVTVRADGAIVDFNPAAERMFGLSGEQARTLRGADLLSADSPMRGLRLAQLAGGGGAYVPAGSPPSEAPIYRREVRARRADGAEFPAEVTLALVAGETPGLFTAAVRDLTGQQRAEAELRDSEERLRLLLDSTGEGIYALDLEGRCTLCNLAALRMLGYRRAEDLQGRSMHDLIHHTHPDGTPYLEQDCKLFLAAKRSEGVEFDDEVFWRTDGTSFPVEYRSYPVLRGRRPVGLVVTFTDITTRRQLEEQIRQSQKLKAIGRLAAGVAHDFNNLLTIINGYADMILEERPDPDLAMKMRSVRQAGERAAVLTHQLLAFSRQQVLQPRVLDLNAMVAEMEPLLRRTLGEDIELSSRLAPDLHAVKADPSQMDQVLMNLVLNARDAIPAGQTGILGRIHIETANVQLGAEWVRAHPGLAAGAFVALAVSDNGSGMSSETQAHIFEPFFTTKAQGKGTGLGLPTVFGIARQSGGTVVVDSSWGRGTTMRVYLPALGAEVVEAAHSQPARMEPGPRGRETILVVEDEAGLRAMLLEVLAAHGYQLLAAANPLEALEISRRHREPFDLLLTDVVMPGMTGHALAAQLEAERPGLRVLFISGYADQALPAWQFLGKPFAPQDLARKVRAVLDAPRRQALAAAAEA